MPSGKIYLVRHGEDGMLGLTEKGRDQANQAAEILHSLIDDTSNVKVLSSNRVRAVQTAGIIGKILQVDMVVSMMLGDAGNNPYKVHGTFTDFLETCFQETGMLRNESDPLIVVTHAPMLAAAQGVSLFEIEHGQVELYDGHTWEIQA